MSPNRREALRWLGAAGVLIVTGCGGSASSASNTTGTTGTTTSSSSSSGACTVTPEGEEGPYFVDDSATGFNRSDIRANIDGSAVQPGILLTLTINVQDGKNNCAAMQNVQVDIWHCNAQGIYSDEGVESTVGENWCRGYQVTDANGSVSFKTIVPGWYQGRTTHIHLRLRSTYDSNGTGGSNTTQLFFPQTLVDTISTSVAPYSAEGKNPTTNASDHVYAGETQGKGLLTLTGDNTNGYTATTTIALPIS
ncbi:MAG TPA: hypothetical protein VGC88_00725 [Terriglobales bacterium]|jgi:protocatechuate 3,4-dioxygenase beta subunit